MSNQQQFVLWLAGIIGATIAVSLQRGVTPERTQPLPKKAYQLRTIGDVLPHPALLFDPQTGDVFEYERIEETDTGYWRKKASMHGPPADAIEAFMEQD